MALRCKDATAIPAVLHGGLAAEELRSEHCKDRELTALRAHVAELEGERSRIVAWLRGPDALDLADYDDSVKWLADAVEGGAHEHRKE